MNNKMLQKLWIGAAACVLSLALGGIPAMTVAAQGVSSVEVNGVLPGTVYDYAYYRSAYPDLDAVFGDNEKAYYQHFLTCGLAEGRSGSAYFNAAAYRARYADLDAAFGDDWDAYVVHYINSGIAEGRDASGDGAGAAGSGNAPAAGKSAIPATGTSSASADNYPKPSKTDKKYNQALEVAWEIANSITGDTDLEKVAQAAYIVSLYCANATYTMEGKDYRTAYGVFIKGEYSCAGSTRALGMVLNCMGYAYEHANENQFTHQWCILNMDGQIGFADGQVGWAGYGPHPVTYEY